MLTVRIITPHGLYKECSAKMVNVVTTDGQRGILPNHIPLVSMLEISIMHIDEDQERETYTIGGGMFYFDDQNVATILVDSIENIKDLDLERARIAKEEAEMLLKNKVDEQELLKAEIALKRAINRLGATQFIK